MMLQKLFNFLAGMCALLCPICFFTALLFLPTDSIAEAIALKVSLFSFAMLFVFGLGAMYHSDMS